MLAKACQSLCDGYHPAPGRSEACESFCGGHDFKIRVSEMIRSTISDIECVLRERAAESENVALSMEADSCTRENLSNAVTAAGAAIDACHAEIEEVGVTLESYKEDLADARAAEKEALREVDAAVAEEKACTAAKRDAEQTLKALESLEEKGVPAKADVARRMLRDVEAQINSPYVSAALFPRVLRAVVPALRSRPEERGSFEQSAITSLQGCIESLDREKAQELATLSAAAGAARQGARRAKEEVEVAKRKTQACADSASGARMRLRECEGRAKEAERAQRKHREDVVRLAREAEACRRTHRHVVQLQASLTALPGGQSS